MSFIIKGGILKKYTQDPGVVDVIIPEGVKSIGKEAFKECKEIVSISIPNSVETIGQSAFYNCRSLKKIIIPEKVSKINDGTFAYCVSLEEIKLPQGINAIGSKKFSLELCRGTFYDCKNLKQIEIPSSCTYVCYDAFASCSDDLVVIAPSVPMPDGKNIHVKRSFGWGFLSCPNQYDEKIIDSYSKYVGSQKKYYLSDIFKNDLVNYLESYDFIGKITKSNYDRDYFTPALEASAVQCVAYLIEWKNRNK